MYFDYNLDHMNKDYNYAFDYIFRCYKLFSIHVPCLKVMERINVLFDWPNSRLFLPSDNHLIIQWRPFLFDRQKKRALHDVSSTVVQILHHLLIVVLESHLHQKQELKEKFKCKMMVYENILINVNSISLMWYIKSYIPYYWKSINLFYTESKQIL